MADNNVGAAGYIITFFNDVESLTNSFAEYSNLLGKFSQKYPNDKQLSKLPEYERNEAIRITYQIKFWLIRSYIKFTSLKSEMKEFDCHSEKIDTLYQELVKTQTPEFDKLQEYVIEINKLFVSGVVSELLKKAYDIYAQFTGTAK